MIKKPADIEYCGVDREKIANANPKVNLEMLKRYAWYQKERTEIYYKKEILKLPAPWTDNKMFQDFKFTMTKRILDRESKNLIDGVINRTDISYENKILNCALFRLINKWTFWNLIPEKFVDFDNNISKELEKMKTLLEPVDVSFFGNAYFLSGTIRAVKIAVYGNDKNIPKGESSPKKSILTLIEYIHKNKDTFLDISKLDNPDEMVSKLGNIYGLGSFLAYQIFADWSYIQEFPFSDNSCVDCGPGTIKGTDHFFDDKDGMSYKECQFWVRDNIERLMKENNLEWDLDKWFNFLPVENRYWGLQDVSNSFCEFDKTTRIWDTDLQQLNRKRVRKFNGNLKE